MRTLIVYYSFTHNNEVLAKYLRETLDADLVKVETVRKRTGLTIFLDLLFNRTPQVKEFYHPRDLYDKYVLIAPIWAGRIASPMKTFLLNERTRIGRYSFITVCGGGPGQKEKVFRSLSKLVGHQPERVSELSLKELLASKPTGNKTGVTSFRLQNVDLKFFREKIDEFLDSAT